jgi:hypothetical protein
MHKKYSPRDYLPHDKLYRGYRKNDLDDGEKSLCVNAISFPDFSCNWSRFSTPDKIRERENGKPTDGCYSFTVDVSRYNDMATPCHDPIFPQNYSHTEVRQLTSAETIDVEPPKQRKLTSNNWSKSKRLEYRQNIVNNLIIELEATG